MRAVTSAIVVGVCACWTSQPAQEAQRPPPPPPPPSVGGEAVAQGEQDDVAHNAGFATPPPGTPSTSPASVPPSPPPPPAPPPPSPPSKAPKGGLRYQSDCSLSNPIARNPCSGVAPSDRGLATCAALGVTSGQRCAAGAPSCYVPRSCPDGRVVPSAYLVCVDKRPGRCLTRSSREYKHAIEYLTQAERDALARLIVALPLARYRYNDAPSQARLGVIAEDAAGTPIAGEDARTVDLYALLAASIATLQDQEARIRDLERRIEACEPRAR